jgi:hypothetical protein
MKEVLEDLRVLHLGITEEVERPNTGKAKIVGDPVRFASPDFDIRHSVFDILRFKNSH